ncbi:type I endonuclease-methyltransferase fusion protein [Bacteroidia bacterium]|nr:type I endonuclease-methyltransferase fusion protein [Bacteroidia bacterium]
MDDNSLRIALGFRAEEDSLGTDGYVVAVDFDKLPDDLGKYIKDFGVDAVYLNTDEDENGNRHSFPAVFLKNVKSFDNEILEQIAEIHKKVWNYKKVLFLYVYSDTEIRIYNCSEKPIIKTNDKIDYNKELQSIELKAYKFSDKKQLKELVNLFSRIAIDTGIIWTFEKAAEIRNKINLQRRVDKYLIKSLVNTANKLKNEGLQIEFIHKIILRSLFLLYLEDRKATDEKFYSAIKEKSESYFNILEDVDATYRLFESLEHYFNGNVFTLERDKVGNITETISKAQLQIIKECFTCGYENTAQVQLFKDFRLFDFSIIQIELLSEIYENFLFETDPKLKKNSGAYYTPPSLVEFVLNDKLPINNNEINYNVKTLDLSCGSGIYLVESFRRLVKRYENAHNTKLTDFDKLKNLLTDNIFGIELHPQAIKIAAFSLYLALVDNLDPKTIWQKEKHKLPYLINNPQDKTLKAQGKNLFCRDTISDISEIKELKDFDLVVGNPPFGLPSANNPEHKTIRAYCTHNGFAQEMVLPFLHKATLFAPQGEIALIFNTKVLTNTGGTYQNFRQWLFNDCYVEKVYNFSILRKAKKDFGGQLFSGATGPISIVFYQKETPLNAEDKIVYYAPKTYIKSNIIEGLSIDYTDLNYLPREECRKPDTKIWKVAMWGGMNDWELIKKINSQFSLSIDDFLKQNKDKFNFGSGLHSPDKKQIEKNQTFVPQKVLNLSKVQKFYTIETEKTVKTSNKICRNINTKIFAPPYLLIKEGQKEKEFCASYIDYQVFNTAACNISVNDKTEETMLKLWCCLINSSFAKYFLTMTSASWGIERERAQANETLSLPALPNIDNQSKEKLVEKFDFLISKIKDDFEHTNTNYIEDEIDNSIFEHILNLSEQDILNINDLLKYSIDLFENQEKSKALLPVLSEQITNYAATICAELNDFLDEPDFFVNATIYDISRFSPLMMIKLSFENKQKDVECSAEKVDCELKKIDEYLWEEKATNIYFRKKLNYKAGDDIYIIRPNQRRFWSQSIAIEDATELIIEILTEN